MDCTSCEELRESAPNFVRRGLTNGMRNHLADNEGYEDTGNKDCEDLNLAADCLLGRMPSSLKSYDDCDWKAWARDFSNNVYQVMSSVIAAICGLWAKVGLVVAPVKVLYTRNVGATGSAIDYWYMGPEDNPNGKAYRHTIDLYIDAQSGTTGTSDANDNITIGSKEADRDYAVIVTHCFDMQNGYMQEYDVTWYCDADASSHSANWLRTRMGQHPEYKNHSDNDVFGMSWPVTEVVYVKKGHHLQCEVFCRTAIPQDGGEYAAKCRVHQIAATWIPITSVEENE